MLPLVAGLAACAHVPEPSDGGIESVLPDARVMWVGAHPDDEALASPVLARACIGLDRPCLMFVMNRGDGGECLVKPGCFPSLGAMRARELARVASAYGAELVHNQYWNAPLPFESFPPRAAIAARWIAAGDPTLKVAEAIRRFRPTVLLTFEPNHGFTGHPEHQLAARFALKGAVMAQDPSAPIQGQPHAIGRVYEVLNHFWITRLAGSSDPSEPNETFDTHVPCLRPGKTCLDVALDITRNHRTQRRDMGTVRALRPQIGTLFLRRVEPETELSQIGPF
ncbi:MAG: PIG-L family deacetylase [Deltaproteobacteria bacterium]|nr:PIG-L family deacetylase [Deltaproteobacteria bacterium]